jgi:hypothetical protein
MFAVVGITGVYAGGIGDGGSQNVSLIGIVI